MVKIDIIEDPYVEYVQLTQDDLYEDWRRKTLCYYDKGYLEYGIVVHNESPVLLRIHFPNLSRAILCHYSQLFRPKVKSFKKN
jgi:hypothetical protein